ncbi:Transposable element Hobo transposase, partial [Frankliniella fusca]
MASQVGTRTKRRPGQAPGNAKADEAKAKKLECIEKLRSGEYSLVENVPLPTDDKWNRRVKPSEAWKKFGRVVVDKTHERTNFVQCFKCKLVKICHVSSGNTGNLTDHSCKPESTQVFDPLPRDVKGTVAELLAALSAENFLPFVLCESESFRKLAAFLVEVGFKHGVVKPEDILPCPKTVATKLHAKADEARHELVEEIKEDLENGLLSGTIDGWTDDQKHRKYMAHTVSHISKDTWEMQDNLLCLPHCHAESVTHEVIDEIIKMEKIKMNIDPNAKIHYVTDDGADVVKAVKRS